MTADLYADDMVRDLSAPGQPIRRVISVFTTPGGIVKVLLATGQQVRADRVELVEQPSS